MDIAVWVVQGLLAAMMLGAGAFKLFTPKEKLEPKMAWTKTWSAGNVKLLGLAEILGAIGVVVPWATHILPILTPIAALALLVIMIGASVTHVRLKESPIPAIIPALMCAFIAFERGYPFLKLA